jgi:hypothetical protein
VCTVNYVRVHKCGHSSVLQDGPVLGDNINETHDTPLPCRSVGERRGGGGQLLRGMFELVVYKPMFIPNPMF